MAKAMRRAKALINRPEMSKVKEIDVFFQDLLVFEAAPFPKTIPKIYRGIISLPIITP
jgi:hypothetical protein